MSFKGWSFNLCLPVRCSCTDLNESWSVVRIAHMHIQKHNLISLWSRDGWCRPPYLHEIGTHLNDLKIIMLACKKQKSKVMHESAHTDTQSRKLHLHIIRTFWVHCSSSGNKNLYGTRKRRKQWPAGGIRHRDVLPTAARTVEQLTDTPLIWLWCIICAGAASCTANGHSLCITMKSARWRSTVSLILAIDRLR